MKKTSKQPKGQASLTRRQLLLSAAATAMTTLAVDSAPFKALATLPTSKANPAAQAVFAPIPTDVLKPKSADPVLAFDPAAVRLLDSPFLDAQKRDMGYMLFLEPDRLMHNFWVNAGLTPKAPIYGGWESAGVAGCMAGHYLSAASMMYRSTGDTRFKDRVDYMVGEIALCQNQSTDGFVCAIPDARTIFSKIQADGTVTGWVPWYTIHKLSAGLRDAHLYCGNAQAKDVFLKLNDWAIGITQNLTYDQCQKMLETEQGGMAETTADAYAMTGDSKYLDLAHRFTHHAVMDPLARREDRLDGLHSNTNIPKMIGYERIYEITGDMPYHVASQFLWQTVTENRSFANGGNGDSEHFFPVADFHIHDSSNNTTETCCSYNMLKLTQQHFQQNSTSSHMDFYERTVYNHILASQEPNHGLMCYLTPFRPGDFKVYNDPTNAFWCCVGTGIENHGRYGAAIYNHASDNQSLYVNLFIPSTLNWRDKGITIRQETKLPETDFTNLTIGCKKPTKLAVKLRKPSWSNAPAVTVNGKRMAASVGQDGYLTLDRTWHDGDVIVYRLPMNVHLQQLPNTPTRCAVMYGPLLMVAALGTDGMQPDIVTDQTRYSSIPALPVPVFVSDVQTVADNIKPVAGSPLTFRSSQMGDAAPMTFIPMYQMHHQRYNTYWSVYTQDEWSQVKAKQEAAEAAERALDARTVDMFVPGNQQSEVDHGLQSANSGSGYALGRTWRDASNGWFSFTMKVDPSQPLELDCTYWGSDSGNRVFDILIDGTQIASQTLEANKPTVFFDVLYPIPAAVIAGKTSVIVKLQAKPGAVAGGLFGCRVLKAE